MGTQQYLRQYSLQVYSDNDLVLDLSKLRFAFAIRRGDTQSPNSADVRIYNVSDNTAGTIAGVSPSPEFTRIVIQAGYDGNSGVIFDGQIKQVRHGRESGVDTYLDISAADGDRAYNYSVAALSLAAGSTPKDHVTAVLQAMVQDGVVGGYIPNDLPGHPLPRGKVIYGMARDELRNISKNSISNWSIQDGKLTLVPLTSYIEQGDIPVITSATGMVGLPEQTQNGIKVRMLLNPMVRIGQAIMLNNASILQYRYNLGISKSALQDNVSAANAIRTSNDGIYYVMEANHSGDTRGNDWYTDVICLSIDAIVPAGVLNQAKPVQPMPGAIKLFG